MKDTLRPFVKSPADRDNKRLGRGFSLTELQKADITVNEAKWMTIPIDRRRKTVNEANIDRLKEYLKRIKETLETEGEKKVRKPRLKAKPKKEKKPRKIRKAEKVEREEEETKKPAKKPEKRVKRKPEKKPPKRRPRKEEVKAEKEIGEEEIEAEAIEMLTALKGLGTAIAKKLIDFGILSLEDLVNMDTDIIAEETGISAERLKKWAKEAKGYLK